MRTTILNFLKNWLITYIVLLFFILLLLFSNSALSSAKKGLDLFLFNVLPSIFPFLVISNILINLNTLNTLNNILSPITRKIFRAPGISSIPIIAGLISGYPVGAKISNDLYEKKLITKSSAENLLSFTNNSGVLFIVSYIGITLYHDTKTGLLLLITHIISAIIVGIIFSFFNNTYSETKKLNYIDNKKNIAQIFTLSVKNSVNTVLIIGGFIIFFSVIISLLTNSNFFYILSIPLTYIFKLMNLPTELIIPILQGTIELTSGLISISALHEIPYVYKICFSSFILGLGGFSIYMQLLAITIENNISTKKYIIGKLLQGFIAYILTYILIAYTPFFNLSIETYTKPYTTTVTIFNLNKINILLDGIIFAFLFITLFKIYTIKKWKEK